MGNLDERYTIDRTSDMDWQIFDGERKRSPLTYLLFSELIQTPLRNIQFILTAYDATQDSPVFEHELWSASFFVANEEQYEKLAANIIEGIEVPSGRA
jgi:hypothetical protein